MPVQNIREAAVVNNLDVYGMVSLTDVIQFFNGAQTYEPTRIDTRKEFYERQLREEQEKDRTEVDESNPFYGYFLRHCKQDGDKGKEENGQSRSVET